MPKKATSKEQPHKCVWVKKNTGLEIKVSEVNNLIDPKMNECGIVIAGKYLNDDDSFIELELIAKDAQRDRINKIWVYKGTSITYNEPFDLQQLTNTKEKNGLISAGTLQREEEVIELEFITKTTQKQRSKVCVYKGTSIPYTEPFDLNQLTNTKKKNGLISAGTLQREEEVIELEFITKTAQNARQELWVYKGTRIPYTEPFDPNQLKNPEVKNGLISAGALEVGSDPILLELISKSIQNARQELWVYKGTSIPYTKPFDSSQLTNPEHKNDLISAGTLNIDGEAILLELISKITQRRRIEIWVYKGTSIPYTEPFNPQQLTNSKRKNGLISEGTLNIDGETISLELISQSTQKRRTEVWVYKGTSIPYTEPFKLDQLTNTKRKNDLISEGTLDVGGKPILLELVSKSTQELRSEVWVCKGTSILYTEPFKLDQLTNTKRKNGLISEGTLNIDGKTISLEFISKNAQNLRQEVWVYKGTSIPYTEPFDLDQLTNIQKKNGFISAGTLNIGGKTISLEFISKNAQRGRKDVWVYKNTSIPYTEPFDLNQLINTKKKKGLISAGTLDVGGEKLFLELISKHTQRGRKDAWVYKGTNIPYTEPFDLNQLTNTKRKNGLISEVTLDVDGEAISLEFISKNAQLLQQEVWVYKGTSIPYTELFDLDQLTNPERKNGLISAGTLNIDGEEILLELVSKSAKNQRQELWVYKGTSIPYTEPFDLDQLTNTKKKNSLISAGTLQREEEVIELEFITKAAQRGRQELWVYKGTCIPYTEPFDLDQLTNPEVKNGLISAGTLEVGNDPILLELISKSIQIARQELWVYKGTSIPYTEPFDPNQLTNPEHKNDLISAGTLYIDGEAILLELISKNTQRGRQEVWVYKGSSISYTEPFDPQQLTNIKIKNGLISEGSLDVGGDSILLELISKGRQRRRQELWVYKGTSIPYTEPFDLNQLINTKRKNDLISEGTLDVDGNPILLELVSKSTQELRQELWVYKGTSIPYTEQFKLDQLINTKRKNGLISEGTLNIGGKTISLEFISKNAQNLRQGVWVYKGTSIPYTEPFELVQLTNTKKKNGLISAGTLQREEEVIELEFITKTAQRGRQDLWVYKGTSIPYTEPFDLAQLNNPEIKNGLISAGTLEADGKIIQLKFITRTKKTHSKNSSSIQEAQIESINNNEAEFEEMDIDSMITPDLMNMINQMDNEQSTYPALPIEEEDLVRSTLKRKSDAIDSNPSKKISTFFSSYKKVPEDVQVQQNLSNKFSS